MAKLSAHGLELARRETPNSRIVVMSDGKLLRNYGQGWKLWKRVKDGVDPVEYAKGFNERTKMISPEIQAYIKALVNACDLEHRLYLNTSIELSGHDPDGVWSDMESRGDWYSIDLEDIIRCCKAYEAARAAAAAKRADEVPA
jgi:hypothetical protein